MDKKYDSTIDTFEHVKRVNQLLSDAAIELIRRGNVHDASKFKSPEKEYFDEHTPKLKSLTFGTPEYNESLKELKVALDHHYEKNSHHPQHYVNGMNDFDLFDLVEMFFDWKASSERHDDGDIYKSIGINKERFGYENMIENIFINTAKRLNWKK